VVDRLVDLEHLQMNPGRQQKKASVWRPVTNWLVYVAVRWAMCLVQALPIETCHVLSRTIALLSWHVLRIRRPVVEENLRHAFPELSPEQRDRMALQMWEHIVLMMCEVAHVPRKLHQTNWRDYVHISDEDMSTFLRYLMDPRPLVTVSGHFGNFEVAGILGGLMGFPSFAVARPLDNPLLDRFVNRFRQRTGQFILPKRGSAQQIDALLQIGGTLMLLGDQAAGPKGCWVEFFGRPASCHKAVALFSLVNRAPMMLSYCRRRDRPMQFELGITAVFDPQVDETSGVASLTQWYSDHLEQMIRQAPGQYWWLHRRWKSRPVRRRRVRRDPPGRAAAPPPHQNRSTPKTSDP
jgi:KDO2-lipid IV(A) lauroyltransferase